MAIMLIDGTKETACRTAEANAIRGITGASAQINYDFDNSKGFADAISGIMDSLPDAENELFGKDMPIKGQLITMDIGNGSKQYRVMKMTGKTTALCVAMYEANTSRQFHASSNVYSGSALDTYLNTTFYNTLSTTAKEAIVATNINQYKYTYNSSVYNATTHASYANYSTKVLVANVGNRNIFALDVEDIEEYFGGTAGSASSKTQGTFSTANIWTLFWNTTAKPSTVTYPWLRSAYAAYSDYVWFVDGVDGYVYSNRVSVSSAARPAFTIDLSKIDFTINT